jgi:hypothetical protein
VCQAGCVEGYREDTESMMHVHVFKRHKNILYTNAVKAIYKCRCGKEMSFVDVPRGEWNKHLPKRFTVA